MDRRSRMREERRQAREQRDREQAAAPRGDIAGSQTPGCL
jgi:hypothetical protein